MIRMDMDEIEATLKEIQITQLAHQGLLTLVLAEFAVASDTMRRTLEDALAQAVEAQEIHIPRAKAEIMPDLYRIHRDIFEGVNRQLTVPLRPRPIAESPREPNQ